MLKGRPPLPKKASSSPSDVNSNTVGSEGIISSEMNVNPEVLAIAQCDLQIMQFKLASWRLLVLLLELNQKYPVGKYSEGVGEKYQEWVAWRINKNELSRLFNMRLDEHRSFIAVAIHHGWSILETDEDDYLIFPSDINPRGNFAKCRVCFSKCVAAARMIITNIDTVYGIVGGAADQYLTSMVDESIDDSLNPVGRQSSAENYQQVLKWVEGDDDLNIDALEEFCNLVESNEVMTQTDMDIDDSNSDPTVNQQTTPNSVVAISSNFFAGVNNSDNDIPNANKNQFMTNQG